MRLFGAVYILILMALNNKIRYVVRNRKARHDYTIQDTVEAGIELRGCEVKSLRAGKVNISDAYAVIENAQLFLKKLHISPYKMAQEEIDPLRTRRLLMHKKEIRKLTAEIDQKGKTLIPLSIYLKGNIAKIELALAVGRRKYDKREAISKQESDRRIRRAIRKDI